MQCLLVGALLALGSLSVNGQVRFLSQREFGLAVAQFQTSTDNIPHREITTTEEFAEKKLVGSVETKREWDRHGNYRVVTKKSDGTVTESIWLGSIQYHRVGNGRWSKTDWSKGGTGSGDGPADFSFFTMEEKFDGGNRILVFTEQTTFETSKRIKITKTSVNSLFWRQRVESTESLGTPDNVVVRSVTTFNYSPGNIELTAPIK
jgi:hypothetical protein